MRFEVGEIAIIAPGLDLWPEQPHSGDEVEIVRVGPFTSDEKPTGPIPMNADGVSGTSSDYEIRCARGWHWFAVERDLRKRRPPIPEEVLTIFTTHKAGQPA